MRAVGERLKEVPGVCVILCRMGFWKGAKACIEASYSPRERLLIAPNWECQRHRTRAEGNLRGNNSEEFCTRDPEDLHKTPHQCGRVKSLHTLPSLMSVFTAG